MSPAPSGLPFLERIEEDWLELGLIESVPVDWVRRNGLVPLCRDGQLIIAGADASAMQAFEDLSLLLGREAVWMTAPAEEIQRAIDRIYFRRAGVATPPVETPGGSEGPVAVDVRSDDLLSSAADAPVAHYVNSILIEAVKRGASDIHIEPFAQSLVVRFRIDGLLYAQPSPPRHLEHALSARLKVMARLDLAEKRLPQDGVARVRVGTREIDVRVSSVPVAEGERIVLRLLHRESTRYSLNDLGLSDRLLERFRAILREPHGIVLVTGPTGSGKTTTLYAALLELDTAHLNVLTIEDPIEYQLQNIGQIQVHPKIGLTFARGLRHILRQDPDVVLVGETRDLETAEIMVRASLTGHLVFTTLHTNDAVGAVTRLVDMGIPSYLLAAAVRAVLAQRLVRRLCPHCRKPAVLSGEDAALLGNSRLVGRTVWEAHVEGCRHCLGGYKGRTGIHELLVVSPVVAEAVRADVPVMELRHLAAAEGFREMSEDGTDKILAGLTTVAEVLRSAGAHKE
ncbi:MAG: Flp pilus assembly complex ATPase component TadA [Verrucomicrobiota bacterium]|jgi:general secretion pathway protein E|nr:Flp pilus assembly complex ATPase component TadA [Verrucomicrobiota bacterium]